MNIPNDLGQALLRSTWSGHRYRLAVLAAMDCITEGMPDTPGNSGLIDRYWKEWGEATAVAIETLEQYDIEEE